MINNYLLKKDCSMIDEIPLIRRDFLFLYILQWHYLAINYIKVGSHQQEV